MLKSVTIGYFQSHKHTHIDLTDGFNVVTGVTHKGKSAIARAIKWVQSNEPRGFGFRSHFAKSKDLTFVELVFISGDTVIRERNALTGDKAINCYKYNDSEPLSALNGNVPDEVRDICNMSELNMGMQGDPHFLISETGGKIAKRINAITGLSDIDTMLFNASKFIKESKSISKFEKNNMKGIQDDIDKLKGIETLSKKTNALVQKSTNCNDLSHQIDVLNDLLTNIEKSDERITGIKSSLKRSGDTTAIKNKLKTYKASSVKLDHLKSILNTLKSHNEKIKQLKSIKHSSTNNIKSKINDFVRLEIRINKLDELLQALMSKSKNISICKTKLSKLKKDRKQLLADQEICPLCKTAM